MALLVSVRRPGGGLRAWWFTSPCAALRKRQWTPPPTPASKVRRTTPGQSAEYFVPPIVSGWVPKLTMAMSGASARLKRITRSASSGVPSGSLTSGLDMPGFVRTEPSFMR